MKKKIALDLQVCLGQRSGVGTYAYELARRMHEDAEATFFGTCFNFLGRNDNTPALRGIDLPVYTNKTVPYGVYRNHWDALPLRYTGLFPAADVTQFFNYTIPPGVKGKALCTIFDMTYRRFPETMEPGNLRRISRDIVKSAARADLILTISEFSKREIMELLHVPEEKLRVVYCAAPVSATPDPIGAVREKFGIDRPYILFLGNTEPRKNLLRLLEAYRAMNTSDVQLVLAGGGGWKAEAITAMAEKLPGVVRTGFITEGEKAALFANAAVFVFPSLYEGFGIPVLEAMESGTPVVCSNAASLPEAAGDAAHYVNPESVEEIAAGLEKVLRDGAYADELRQRGRAQTRRFSWDTSALQLREIYKTLL